MNVSFVDGGKSFFECNQAEARKAIDFIVKLRKSGEVLSEAETLKQRIRQILNARSECVIRGMVVHGYIRATHIADIMGAMEQERDRRVTHLLMSAKAYAGIRCWDRDTCEMETRAEILKTGKMARLWGADICISKECVGAETHSLIAASIEDGIQPVFYEFKITFLLPEPVGAAKQDVVIKALESLILQIRNG